eukprot:Nitzschia sp. Nitz4//scaffold459_size6049//1310//1706//NITZ4_009190-RA/size6049-exonerate_est2genome-gene-0.1-mRNA-1//1//CDS//3329552316//4947//frame0
MPPSFLRKLNARLNDCSENFSCNAPAKAMKPLSPIILQSRFNDFNNISPCKAPAKAMAPSSPIILSSRFNDFNKSFHAKHQPRQSHLHLQDHYRADSMISTKSF